MAFENTSSALTELELPFAAEVKACPRPRFAETIVLVPFFGGKRANLKRHWEFLNSIGFNCVVFELYEGLWRGGPTPISSDGRIGFKHLWADQVERVLNEIQGRKIVFAFSNPAASAIEAIARRRAVDIRALICDSGPSGKFWNSMDAYFQHEEPIRIAPLRWLAAGLTAILWNPRVDESLKLDLAKLPPQFPILSIRGWKDPLIPPDHIDLVFESALHLDWRKLNLPEAEHLNGLKDFASDYGPPLVKFLEEVGTPSV